MLHFCCPHCKKGLEAANGSGKLARCPNCLALIEVPVSLGGSASLAGGEEPVVGLSATTVSTSPPKQFSDTQDLKRRQARRRTNFILLGLALAGLIVAVILLRDAIPRNQLSNDAAQLAEQLPTADLPSIQPPFPVRPIPSVEQPAAQPGDVAVMVPAPVAKPRLRLGTRRFHHPGGVDRLVVAPGNKVLVSYSRSGQVYVLDAATGIALRHFSVRGERPFTDVALSADGRWVAGAYGEIVSLWDVATGKMAASWQVAGSGGNLGILSFAPDGQSLAFGSGAGLFVWEVPGGTKLRGWQTNRLLGSLTFSPDGKTLAVCLPGSAIRFLDLGVNRQRCVPDSGVALAFSPDSRTAAVVGRGGILRLWETSTGQQIRCPEVSLRNMVWIAFSPDGTTLASVDQHEGPWEATGVRLWQVATGKQLCRLQRLGHRVEAIAFSEDGKTLYTGGADTVIRLWNTGTGEEIQREEDKGPVLAVAIAPDGKTAVTAGTDTILRAWDLISGQRIRQYRGHQWCVTCLAYSADGGLLASGAGRSGPPYASELRLWDVHTAKELRRLDKDTYVLSAVRFHPSQPLLEAVEAGDGTVHVWKTETGEPIHQFGGDSGRWSAFSPDGALLALWQPESVKVWDVAGNRLIREFRPEVPWPLEGNFARDSVNAVALSPGGHFLACVMWRERGRLYVFDTATGKRVELPEARVAAGWPVLPTMLIRTLAWSHDGKTLASGGAYGQVVLWDLATATAMLRCEGHAGSVMALAFSADDQTLVSGSDDTTALVWDLAGLRDTSRQPQP